MSIWSLTFLGPCWFSPYRYALDKKADVSNETKKKKKIR